MDETKQGCKRSDDIHAASADFEESKLKKDSHVACQSTLQHAQ
jgi:hypothetical protein